MITLRGTPVQVSGSSITSLQTPSMSWVRGDVVCVAVRGTGSSIVSANPTNTGNGLGQPNWAKAASILSNFLDTELWYCPATQDGSGQVTVHFGDTEAIELIGFVLKDASTSNFVHQQTTIGLTQGVVDPAALTATVANTQALLVYDNGDQFSGAPTPPAGFTTALTTSDDNFSVYLQSTTNSNGATVDPATPGNEGQGSPGIPSNAITLLMNTNGTAPGTVTVGTIAQDSVQLTMPALPSGATSLSLTRSTSSTGPFTTVATGLTGNQNYTDNDGGTLLLGNTTYYYDAVAIYATSQPFSANTTITTLPYYAPGIVTFDPNGTTQESLAVIMPVLPFSASSLSLQRSTSSTGPYSVVATGLTGSQYHVDPGLSPGITYYYEAVAIYGHGQTAGAYNYNTTKPSYADFETSPYSRWTTVGVQAVKLYPYGGPYDATTEELLEGLNSVDFAMNVSLSEGFGGESPLLLFSAETKREIDLKASAFKVSLRVAQLLLGGNLAVDGTGQPNEKQYWAGTYTGRAQFFRMACTINNGDGTAQLVFPKIKCVASLSWNMKAEVINVTEFSGRPHFDSTYVCQNGQVGAIFDWFFGYGVGNTSPMS